MLQSNPPYIRGTPKSSTILISITNKVTNNEYHNTQLFELTPFALYLIDREKWNIMLIDLLLCRMTEAVSERSSTKQVFLRFSQNSLENTCIGIPLSIKLQASSFVKILITPCSQNISGRKLLMGVNTRHNKSVREGKFWKFPRSLVNFFPKKKKRKIILQTLWRRCFGLKFL